ncbi:uncharacterized protein LOC124452305 isoform X2 [Xenia sp. Carnegie-2017]|uniref:uncharacterized protein LOC124452305 isoform X2 n=1 Tax=Xenia sp. Carnegie-2017 TaxID=2897299 RepID=UPI001F033A69|nr:uncharacterized protein LOC124452305 isoform X2 [Xenia sp. Carnegie-2017]
MPINGLSLFCNINVFSRRSYSSNKRKTVKDKMGSQKIDPRNKVKLPLQRKGYKIREQYESKQASLRRKKREAMAKKRKKSPQLLLQENTAKLRETLMKTAGNAMKRSNAIVNTNHGSINKNTNLNKSPNKAKIIHDPTKNQDSPKLNDRRRQLVNIVKTDEPNKCSPKTLTKNDPAVNVAEKIKLPKRKISQTNVFSSKAEAQPPVSRNPLVKYPSICSKGPGVAALRQRYINLQTLRKVEKRKMPLPSSRSDGSVAELSRSIEDKLFKETELAPTLFPRFDKPKKTAVVGQIKADGTSRVVKPIPQRSHSMGSFNYDPVMFENFFKH